MAAYAAGNAVLDNIAHVRQGFNQPALSLNWGPWDTGLSLSSQNTLKAFQAFGLEPFSMAEGIETLGQLFFSDEPQLTPVILNRKSLSGGMLTQRPLFKCLCEPDADKCNP